MLLRTLTFFLTILLLSLTSCRKCDDPCNKECDNYDPCCGLDDLSAHFTIFEDINTEGIDNINIPALGDTIIGFNYALFKASVKDADSYTWAIGSDPRSFDSPEVRLRFLSVPDNTQIPVTLTIKKRVDAICHPENLEEVTFTETRILTVVPLDSSKVIGRFEGHRNRYPNQDAFFQISLEELPPGNNPTPFMHYVFSGLLPECGYKNSEFTPSMGYNHAYFNTISTKLGCCYGVRGVVYTLNGRDVTVNFDYFDSSLDTCQWSGLNDSRIDDQFTGYKTN